jgi:hypothetical protein
MDAKGTWAELHRGSDTLLVPYLVWFSAVLETASKVPEKAVWNEVAGTWRVSAQSAAVLASVIERKSPGFFTRTLARADFGPGVSGTVSIPAVDPEAGPGAKADLLAFLRRGDFQWRYISL